MAGLETELLGHAGLATVGICSAAAEPGSALWGSGFFVAPGWVLTCAHVLAHRDGRRRGTDSREGVGVVHDGRVLRGRLEYGMPGPAGAGAQVRAGATGPGPYEVPLRGLWPDLALIRVLDPPPGHSCAWLGERSSPLFDEGYVLGGTWEGHGGIDPPWYRCSFADQSHGQLHLGTRSLIAEGTSGGPLLDPARGEVIGVIKARSTEGTGGLAVPLTALRELSPAHLLPGAEGLGPDPYHALMGLHDRWHSARQGPGQGVQSTWADTQRALASDGPDGRRPWGVLERLKALELLAALPAPPDPRAVEEAVNEALGLDPDKSWTPRLRTWRDGHGELYRPDGYEQLRACVRYLLRVARDVRDAAPDGAGPEGPELRQAARLADWAEEQAGALAPGDRDRIAPVRQRPSSVLVEFEPLAYGDAHGPALFNWSVSRGYGAGSWKYLDVCQSPEGLPFDRAREAVQRLLVERLRAADEEAGEPVRLEVALPDDRLATRADRWPVPASRRPTALRRPVGATRPVVLRDVTRRGEVDQGWLDRWRRAGFAETLLPLRVGPAPGRAWRLLEEAGGGAVPVLCHTVAEGPGRESAQTALDCGYAVALWRADGHRTPDCDDRCEEFHQLAAELLGGRPVEERDRKEESGLEADRPGQGGFAGADALSGAPPAALTAPPPVPSYRPPGVRDLPERVRDLRERAEGLPGDGAHGLLLFYDDPRNPLPASFGPVGHLSLS